MRDLATQIIARWLSIQWVMKVEKKEEETEVSGGEQDAHMAQGGGRGAGREAQEGPGRPGEVYVCTVSESKIREEGRLRGVVHDLEEKKNTKAKQRSHVAWLKDGNRNTSYFMAVATARRKKNKIKGLRREDGTVVKEGEEFTKEGELPESAEAVARRTRANVMQYEQIYTSPNPGKDAFASELYALAHAISLAADLGLVRVIFETDSSLLMEAMDFAHVDASAYAAVIEDLKFQLKIWFSAHEITVCRREANSVAHQLASIGRMYAPNHFEEWENLVPAQVAVCVVGLTLTLFKLMSIVLP
ncbi:Glutamyl-tRNA reductase 1, chloroplastic [Hordeum vulgare]|nr:Glutamyl-tRNA reductase 1, chloroplastic [Hordeum vulgare]